jgi:hypothetical protein
MPITALQGTSPELEKALQLALEPVATELRNSLFQKMLALLPATEQADESFRLRADALVESLLADLKTLLPQAVTKGLLEPKDSEAQAYLEALTQLVLAGGSPQLLSVGAQG